MTSLFKIIFVRLTPIVYLLVHNTFVHDFTVLNSFVHDTTWLDSVVHDTFVLDSIDNKSYIDPSGQNFCISINTRFKTIKSYAYEVLIHLYLMLSFFNVYQESVSILKCTAHQWIVLKIYSDFPFSGAHFLSRFAQNQVIFYTCKYLRTFEIQSGIVNSLVNVSIIFYLRRRNHSTYLQNSL